jgi:MbtH protein
MTEQQPRQYRVVFNAEGQYSVWAADQPVPAGWRPDGKTGARDECLEWIDEVCDGHAAGWRRCPSLTPVRQLVAGADRLR